MKTSSKIIIGVVYTAIICAVTYYLVPVKKETVVQVVEKKVTEIKTNEVKVEVKKPDGTIITRTEIVTNTKETNKSDTSVKQVTEKPTGLSINAMVGINDIFSSNGRTLTYGAHVSSRLLGPVELGAFGFTNGMVGMTVGLRF